MHDGSVRSKSLESTGARRRTHTQEALLHEDAGRVYLNLHNRRIFFKVLFQRFGEAQ